MQTDAHICIYHLAAIVSRVCGGVAALCYRYGYLRISARDLCGIYVLSTQRPGKEGQDFIPGPCGSVVQIAILVAVCVVIELYICPRIRAIRKQHIAMYIG